MPAPDMPRTLLLLRNGKAEPDPPRDLRDSGKRQVQRVGVWMAGECLQPDYVITTPSARARVSAQKALKAGGMGAGDIRPVAQLRGAGLAAMLEVLRTIPVDAACPLIVAHRGALEGLAAHLLGKSRVALGTGTLLRLGMPADWSVLAAGCARRLAEIRPADLPERFPFPGPGGSEWRDRPAYYYRQSAVIPWRLRAGKLEVLVISSSKRNHWVVPKGIHEPGLSAQVSAAHEAEEEAGVRGEVGATALGRFELEKWGARCRVDVYPMRVNEVISAQAWEERHRERLWLSPEKAQSRLKYEGLRRILAAFARQKSGGQG